VAVRRGSIATICNRGLSRFACARRWYSTGCAQAALLCMSSAVTGYKRAFGADVVPCSYEDVENSDLVVINPFISLLAA
jgi:anaerobic selenocysteine-containing dehydrogenase